MRLIAITLTVTLAFSIGSQSRIVCAEPNVELNVHNFNGQTLASSEHHNTALSDPAPLEDENYAGAGNGLRDLGNTALMVLGIGSMAVGGLGLIASGSSSRGGSLDQAVTLTSLALLAGGVISTVLGHRGMKTRTKIQKSQSFKYKKLKRSDPIKAQYLKRTALKSSLEPYILCNKLAGVSTVFSGLITGYAIIRDQSQQDQQLDFPIEEFSVLALGSAGIWYYCGKQYFTIKEKLRSPWHPISSTSSVKSQTAEWVLPTANSNSLGLSYGFTF